MQQIWCSVIKVDMACFLSLSLQQVSNCLCSASSSKLLATWYLSLSDIHHYGLEVVLVTMANCEVGTRLTNHVEATRCAGSANDLAPQVALGDLDAGRAHRPTCAMYQYSVCRTCPSPNGQTTSGTLSKYVYEECAFFTNCTRVTVISITSHCKLHYGHPNLHVLINLL